MKRWNLEPLPQGEYVHEDNGSGKKFEGKLVLRPSSIDAYIRCPYSFYRQQMLGEYGAPNSASQVGTALHYVMEVALNQILDGEGKPEEDELQRVGLRAWKDYNEKANIVYHGDQTYASMADDLFAGVKALHEAIDFITPVGSESRHSARIVSHPVFSAVSGSLDIETDKGVVDLKFTGKKKSKPDDYILQQSCYSLQKNINGIENDKLEILNIVRPTKAKKAKSDSSLVADWHIMEMKPNEAYVIHWIDIILAKTNMLFNFEACNTKEETEEYAELLFQGTSPSNSFLCNDTWCSHYKTCPHVKALRDADADPFQEMVMF